MNLESALMRIYEEPAYRDELPDAEAQILLTWAEGQITRLMESAADEGEFDTRYESFRGLLKTMNRLAGRRAEMDAASLGERLRTMRDAAAQMGVSISDEQIEGALAALTTLDDAGAVQALTTLFTPAEPSAAPAEPAPTPQPPTSARLISLDDAFDITES